MKINKWMYVIRLHTLCLSFSGITLSFLISKSRVYVNLITYLLSLLTALSLQILSNISNYYGDNIKILYAKYNNLDRKINSNGLISLKQIINAIKLFSLLSFLFGLILIINSIDFLKNFYIFFLYFLGILICIYSSINYSIGHNPYGYRRLGDLFVMIFFGIVSINGSYFLYTTRLSLDIFLLSLSIGFMNVAVLNINNIRDIETDLKHNKLTIANLLGNQYAKIYHIILIILSVIIGIIFIIMNNKNYFYHCILFTLIILLLIDHINCMLKITNIQYFNLELKKLIVIIVLYTIIIGFGCFL
ncbi:1,4-dihydroxy-2-naphthoate octaprenyltransferase [Blattabacterium cuenoti]|uniref:1,4-dihydroxy-2-naphthoate octaprenyltransferase n=1 Tax=Blattabacterium cuenoti TaxID=1653831 RepID=UPI00163C331C|nr:1,4-dihydroxy-2-naphthoate octaprenyltransferase [Blattabacterium cuenoti]